MHRRSNSPLAYFAMCFQIVEVRPRIVPILKAASRWPEREGGDSGRGVRAA